MDISTAVAFWGVSFLFVITPGADWAYAINAGLQNRVTPAVIGLLFGHLVATLAVAAGVGALVARVPVVLTTLTVLGALYLLWLGVSTLITPAVLRSATRQSDRGWTRWALKGAGISGLNPKVFLLFLALLPQFTNPDADWPVSAQLIALGLVHIASCAVIYTIVGTGARAVLGSRQAAARVVSRVAATAMIVIGLVLIGERLL